MGVNSLPKTVTRQRRGCDLNPGPSAPESSTLTTRLPSSYNTEIFDRAVVFVEFGLKQQNSAESEGKQRILYCQRNVRLSLIHNALQCSLPAATCACIHSVV